MKFRLLSILAIGLLIVFAPAQAGKGGPIAEGFWQGAGQAIYPDGTFAEITRVEALLFQDGNFIGTEPVAEDAREGGAANKNRIVAQVVQYAVNGHRADGAVRFETAPHGKTGADQDSSPVVDNQLGRSPAIA